MAFDTIASHLVYTSPLGPGSVVADGGAHKGWFAEAVAGRFGCRVFGFELEAGLFFALRPTDRVTYTRAALCGREGPVGIAAGVSGDHPIGTGLAHLGGGGATETVPGLDFPALLRAVGGRLDLLKLDIEGAEIEFLDSAPDDALAAVGQLTIEFHDHCGITPPAEVGRVCRRLRGLGFRQLWSSWRVNTHDTLFAHRRVMSGPQFAWQMYPVRYARAVGRVARRATVGGRE